MHTRTYHALEGVDPLGIIRQAPVPNGHIWRRERTPPLMQVRTWRFYLLDDVDIGMTSSLFEVSDEAMEGFRVIDVHTH